MHGNPMLAGENRDEQRHCCKDRHPSEELAEIFRDRARPDRELETAYGLAQQHTDGKNGAGSRAGFSETCIYNL